MDTMDVNLTENTREVVWTLKDFRPAVKEMGFDMTIKLPLPQAQQLLNHLRLILNTHNMTAMVKRETKALVDQIDDNFIQHRQLIRARKDYQREFDRKNGIVSVTVRVPEKERGNVLENAAKLRRLYGVESRPRRNYKESADDLI